MVDKTDQIVVNIGHEFTFGRSNTGSIIDLKIANAGIVTRIGDWDVLDEVTLSDYRYIEFSI